MTTNSIDCRIITNQRFPFFCASWLLPVLLLFLLALPAAVQAQWYYTSDGVSITITRYTGTNNDVVIPSTINGLPVTGIDGTIYSTSYGTIYYGAFHGSPSLNRVAIPNSVTNITEWGAFSSCTNLTLSLIPI